tara:strand:+ start:352 stop:495 length:144 start_codon:yes stop_codon:yes gene_type:complete
LIKKLIDRNRYRQARGMDGKAKIGSCQYLNWKSIGTKKIIQYENGFD